MDPRIENDTELDEVHQRFITEFLVDRDAFAAAQRTGVAKVALNRTVKKWMNNPSILRAIREATDAQDFTKMVTPQRIIAGFMDVAFDRTAPQASRNTALRELATLNKMYGEDDKDSKSSGVIMVPVAGSLEDWQAMAAAAQNKLKEDVRD